MVKTVVMVANFAPRKMAGEVSEGMLLCAEDENGVKLLTVDGSVAPEARSADERSRSSAAGAGLADHLVSGQDRPRVRLYGRASSPTCSAS